MRHAATLLILCAAARAATHPNFTGTWRLSAAEYYIVDQNPERLRVIMIIQDQIGTRTLDMQGPIDGQPHAQPVTGSRGTFQAHWDGDTLNWETRRETPDGVLHNRRSMRLSPDGHTITARRTRVAPAPEETFTETWKRQDPVLPPTTCFQDRDAALAPEATPLERGMAAARFHFRELAERDLLPVIRGAPNSRDAQAARSALVDLYVRGGQTGLALAQQPDAFFKALARRPELSVVRRAPSVLRYTPESDGRIGVPVTAAGKPAVYRIDTGSSIGLLTRSEAARLGVKVERLSMTVQDLGGGELRSHLAIVPTLAIGKVELSGVPFWVIADKQLGAPGILGIDVLLAMQTLRWNSDGTIEIGFPSAPADLRRANLCFDGSTPIAEVSHGRDALAFVVDTGNTDSSLFPSFATQFPGDIATGLQASSQVSGYVGRSTLKMMKLPSIGLRVGDWETDLRPADVSLDHVPLWSGWHYGCAGMDLLNRARSVAFDFAAMRLTLEGAR